MNNNTIIIIVVVVFLALIVLKIIFHKREVKVIGEDKSVNIDDVKVEYSDLQHYIDTEKVFNDRMMLYNVVANPTTEIKTNLNIDVPDVVAYHIAEDTQNVHDTNIQKNLKGKYSQIHQVIQPLDTLKDEIINHCKNDIQAKKVYDIICKIQDRNAHLTNFNANEEDILKNVWFSANENIKKQIVNELLDCVDQYDVLYCPTGVASRLVNASYIDNPEKAPKTKQLLNQEIMHKFGINFEKLKNKNLAKERTIDEYYGVYDRKDIEDLINEWYDYI